MLAIELLPAYFVKNVMVIKTSIYYLLLAWLFVSSCSPKIQPTKKKEPKPVVIDTPISKRPAKRFSQAEISLLVPFRLDQLNLNTATKAEIEKYAMPIDFYQGFTMGIDSASLTGLNFKVNVYDTQDNNPQIEAAYKKDWFKNSNLIVGPVFPEGIKYITNFSKENNLPVVSPLAASHPEDFGNPNLISIVGNIDLHAKRIASYIGRVYSPVNTIVVVINPKRAEDEQFARPFLTYINTLKSKFLVQEYPSSNAFETKLIKGKQYVVLVASSDRSFVNASIDKFYRLKNLRSGGYNISLFGHPNWVKQNFSIDKLQALNTIISSSYKIDYKRPEVISFIKKYRSKFGFEPSEYSYKGYDIGFYFGNLMAKYGKNYMDFLTKEKHEGLHTSFSFKKDEKTGYVNTPVVLLRYNNFALSTVE